MKGLTHRQHEILHFIEEFIRIKGFSPTYKEIKDHFSLSSLGTIYKHLYALKKKGLITSEKGHKSSIKTVNNIAQSGLEISIPLIGKISEGVPLEIFSQSIPFSVPKDFVRFPEKTYVLQVIGDSLNEEFICDKDYLIVEASQDPPVGSTIVALINHHDTIVKRYFLEGSYIYLTGNNPHHKPILLRPEDVRIQGTIVTLIRKF